MASPISPDIAYRWRSVADPSLSPDGSRLAYSQSWFESDSGKSGNSGDSGESRSRVMLLELATGKAEEFTQGKRDSAPRFSPDGSALGFLRKEDDAPGQVWVMDVSGGEARRLTDMPQGVRDFSWSPDGQRLVFFAYVDP